MDSLLSDNNSSMLSLAALASSKISSGISFNSNFAPSDSPSQTANFISIKSTMPSKTSLLKYGICSLTGFEPSLDFI